MMKSCCRQFTVTSNTPAAFWYRSTAFSRFRGSISLKSRNVLVWGESACLCMFYVLLCYRYFPALSRAMAAVSGVPFSMYIIQAFSMYWMASGIFFSSCWGTNTTKLHFCFRRGAPNYLLLIFTLWLTFIIIPACSIALRKMKRVS